jgi:transcriptional repressor NrdR
VSGQATVADADHGRKSSCTPGFRHPAVYRRGVTVPASQTSLACPICGAASRVLETRTSPAEDAIRRRRQCGSGHRFTSWELREAGSVVRKRDGRLEPFDEAKLRGSIELARVGLAVDADAIVSEIRRHAVTAPLRTNDALSTIEIGTAILVALLDQDPSGIAALRYGSVFLRHRDLASRDDLLEEIDAIVAPQLYVVKRADPEDEPPRKEPFDHSKLLRSLRRALSKTEDYSRAVEFAREIAAQIDQEARTVEAADFRHRQIDADRIGRLVLRRLARVNWVSYARYLSAFNPDEFQEEVERVGASG